MRVWCAIAAMALWAASGMPGLVLGRRGAAGERIATALGILGSLIGLYAVAGPLVGLGDGGAIRFRGVLPDFDWHLRLDALCAFFLVPIFVIGAAGSVYGLGYWPQRSHPRTGRQIRLCYGLLIGSMTLVVLAGDGILFLFAWEMMALSAFFLVRTEHWKREVREAGWLYLLAAHAGTLILFGMFAMLRAACGSFELRAVDPAHAGWGLRAGIFLTALAGFGFKAGVMPLHFWLPAAHANAPTHVSAILSGVMLKMGIYGILRTLTLLPPLHPAWGGLTLILGAASALLGVLFALAQHDLKRLLAYHSIENIGIILMGLGLAIIGEARGKPEWIVLGLAGCILHVWNHALFKSLLFFSAGSVLHATGTRQIERMGGLARPMPTTATMFFIGALAICGLPPLNGFVSELFIYLGLMRATVSSPGVALAAPMLAMAGALALACFVKVYGTVFLGLPRFRQTAPPPEAPSAMTIAMAVAALGCVVIGLFPTLFVDPLDRVVGEWSHTPVGGSSVGALAPLRALTGLAALLAAIAAIGWLRLRQTRATRRAVTWDCGYAHPNSRMQYTASSFSQMLVGAFGALLKPRTHRPSIDEPFPPHSAFHSEVDDLILDRRLRPWWSRFRFEITRLRFLQQGSVQTYLLYILVTLFVLLLTAFPIIDLARRLFMEE
jgi:hydrogenase-4 component B